jgi:hypothetical protein
MIRYVCTELLERLIDSFKNSEWQRCMVTETRLVDFHWATLYWAPWAWNRVPTNLGSAGTSFLCTVVVRTSARALLYRAYQAYPSPKGSTFKGCHWLDWVSAHLFSVLCRSLHPRYWLHTHEFAFSTL